MDPLPRRILLPKLARLARDPVEGPLLELGCRKGAATEEILRRFRGLEVTAVEPDPASAIGARLRLSGRARVDEADLGRLPYAAGAFRTVVSLLALHRVEDYERAVREAHRVLAPGGQLLLADLTSAALRGPAGFLVAPRARFAKSALRTALEATGLHVDVLTGEGLVFGRAVKEAPPRQAAD